MDSLLKVEVNEQADAVIISLRGVVSDSAKLELSSLRYDHGNSRRRIILDTGGIITISAAGVRKWMAFLQELCAESPNVLIRNLAPILCTQASSIPNFLGQARVETFYTPWCCLDCYAEDLKLHRITDVIPEHLPCPECNGEMEFDDILESYLAFRDRSLQKSI